MIDISLLLLDDKKKNALELTGDYTGMVCEAADNYLDALHAFEVTSAKIEAYTEQVEREYNINVAKAELKCYEEDGTQEDFAYLEEAASDGAIKKLANLIDAAIEAIKAFFSRIKTGTLKFICSAETRQTLKTANKKVKLNPILARKKVKITSTKKALSIINTYKNKCDKSCAKTVKGLLGEHERKTLMDTKENFRKDFKSAITGAAAIKTLTVSALIVQLTKDIDKLPAYLQTAEQQNTAILERLKGSIEPGAAAAAQAAVNSCVNFRNELVREETNTVIDGIMEEMRELKKAVMTKRGNQELETKVKSKGAKKKGKAVEESAEDDFNLDDLLDFEEDTEDDDLGEDEEIEESAEAYLEELLGDEDEDVEESAEDDEDDDSEPVEEGAEDDDVDVDSYLESLIEEEAEDDDEDEEEEPVEESAEVDTSLEEIFGDLF